MKTRTHENKGKKGNWASRKRSFLMYGLLALVVVTVAVAALQIIPGGTENSSATVYSWNGDGTEGNPYQISSVDDLANLANDVNINGIDHLGDWFALTEDIYLNGTAFDADPGWTPIGIGSVLFCGNLNGNGNTIHDLYINNTTDSFLGLFGRLSGSTIEDLNLENVKINSVGIAGSVAGYAESTSFENCYISCTITSLGGAGGLTATTSNCTVNNCGVTGTVTGSASVGGLIGFNFGSVTNCHNKVDVIINGSGSNAGGLIGSNNSGTIENCSNVGDVTSSGTYVGGLIGLNSGSVENCFASGTVSGSYVVGGLIGYNGLNTVNNCYSTGAVNCSGMYVGGLVGYIGNGTIENCYNASTVTGSDDGVGGVVGFNTGGTVENCYNIGEVTGSGNSVGGVAGFSYGGTIENCYNTGPVTIIGSGDNVGGVVGNNTGTVENCYNIGEVTGSGESVGGVVGRNYYGTIEDCFFLHESGFNDLLSGFFDVVQNNYSNDGAEPIGDAELHTQITYPSFDAVTGKGWDFDNVWGMYPKNNGSSVSDYGTPYLKTIDNFILITPDGGSKVYDGNPAPDPAWTADRIVDESLFTGSLSYVPTPAVDVDTYKITIGDLYSPYYQLRFDDDVQYTITAPPAPAGYTITPSSDANSSITPSTTVTVQSGGSYTFTFSAASGYHISSVLVDGKAIDQVYINAGSYTFTNVIYNRTIDVKSTSGAGPSGTGTSITLTVDIVGGNGAAEYRIGSGQYISFTGVQIIPIGSDLYVSVIPDNGYSFVEWTGDVNSKDIELNFGNVSSDIHLVAHLSNDNATGSAGKSGNFAILNLILAILALLIGIIAIFAGIWGRKDEEKRMSGTAVIAGLLALIVGIISLIVFFLTEDLSAPMITTDNWTIWMVVLFVVAVILAAITFWAGGRKVKGKD